MRFQSLGPKRDFVNVKVRYDVAVTRGQPVCLVMDGTEDGLAVGLPSGAAARAHSLFMGVANKTAAADSINEAQVFGYCDYAMLFRGSRAASTAAWASADSIGSLALLAIDTVGNAFVSTAASQAVSGFLPYAILLESVASVASSASATSDTRTALTTNAKIFLRAM